MSDPIRLREAGDAFEMGLLASAKGDVASDAVHENVQKALGLGAAAATVTIASTSTAAGAAKGATTLVGVAGAKWLGVILVAGVAAGGASVYVRGSHATDVTTATPTPTAAPTAASTAASTRTSAPTAATTPSSTANSTPHPVSTPHPTSTAHPTPPPSAPTGLTAELAPIDAARAAFDSGNTALALDQLNRHDLAFPHGQLAPEALALRVEIYASRHDDAKVRELTGRFLASYPTHPDAARMRSLAEASSGAKANP